MFPDPKGSDEDCDIVEWQNPKHESFSDPNTICAFHEDNVEFGWSASCRSTDSSIWILLVCQYSCCHWSIYFGWIILSMVLDTER